MGRELFAPVLFLVFNQPQITARTFEEIRKAKPRRLFIAADGPRKDRTGEDAECQATRDLILNGIDWECDVKTRFLETNWGCKRAVSSGISWFLEEVGEGIILEYDCLPSQSFFGYCQELLERYRQDTRVMAINGSNFMFGKTMGEASYYFSKIPSVWGWATWKRAWDYWDGELLSYPRFKNEKGIANVFRDPKAVGYWAGKFEEIHTKSDTTWGYPWCYAVISQNGVCVTPNVNLISNIGFTQDATHATDLESPFASLPLMQLGTLAHPVSLVPNLDADEFHTRCLAHVKFSVRVQLLVKGAIRRFLPRYYEFFKTIYRKMRSTQ